MKATKPNVTKALRKARIDVAATPREHRTKVTVGDRHRTEKRVRVWGPHDMADPNVAVYNADGRPDANGYHWHYTEEYLHASFCWALNTASLLRSAGFQADIATAADHPAGGGDWWVEVKDRP